MKSIKLRTVLAVTVCALTGLAIVVSLALVRMTTSLLERSDELAASVEGVALSQQAATDLLVHERAVDAVARYEVERDVLSRLDEARAHVTSPAEASIMEAARAAVKRYLGTPDDPRLHEEAYAALASLVEVNREQARAARDAAARADTLANRIGVGVAALVVLITGTMLWWLHARVFRPMLTVADAMDRFGSGALDARAREAGPAEVRAMARQFNVMATTLAVHRDTQMALLGGVAHDLRVPLGAMTLTIGLLETVAAAQPAVDRMRRITARLDRMIGDLLDVTRIEAGRLRIERGLVDVRAVIQDTLVLLERQAVGRSVHTVLPPQPLIVRGDSMRLEQALGNLVGNALKYSPQGSAIEVRASADDAAVTVEIEDHGQGMSDEDRRALFAPFRRGASATGTAGAGLGLYVTRGIVTAHGGSIAVETIPGRGSVFRISLPATRGDSTIVDLGKQQL